MQDKQLFYFSPCKIQPLHPMKGLMVLCLVSFLCLMVSVLCSNLNFQIVEKQSNMHTVFILL